MCAVSNLWYECLKSQQTLSKKLSLWVIKQAEDLNPKSRKVNIAYNVSVNKTNCFHYCMQTFTSVKLVSSV
jgi:hypothetical protein